MKREASPTEFIWAPAGSGRGNSHRSELNIEKLWNPYLGARGLRRAGSNFVPFHGQDAAMLSAEAALLRAVARLMYAPYDEPLIDQPQLHNRFCATCYPAQICAGGAGADLERRGLGLGAHLEPCCSTIRGASVQPGMGRTVGPVVAAQNSAADRRCRPSNHRTRGWSMQSLKRIELRVSASDLAQLADLALQVMATVPL